MMELIFNGKCLEGDYTIKINQVDNEINYVVLSTISSLENKEGNINTDDFLKKFSNIHLDKWVKEYKKNDLGIEDAVKWNLEYRNDNASYSIDGIEGDWPYEYDDLIETLSIIDKNIEYFKANKK